MRLPAYSASNICEDHNVAWISYGKELARAFAEANNARPHRPLSAHFVCEHIFTNARLKCSSRGCQKIWDRANFDHAELWLSGSSGAGLPIIVNQPYEPMGNIPPMVVGDRHEHRFLEQHGIELRTREFAIRNGGRARSWYFPGNANLYVVGWPSQMDLLDLDYPVPPPPKRVRECHVWQTNGEDQP